MHSLGRGERRLAAEGHRHVDACELHAPRPISQHRVACPADLQRAISWTLCALRWFRTLSWLAVSFTAGINARGARGDLSLICISLACRVADSGVGFENLGPSDVVHGQDPWILMGMDAKA